MPRVRIALCVGDCFRCDRGLEAAIADLEREGVRIVHAPSQETAAQMLCDLSPAVVVIDLGLARGSPLAVADLCSYRRPEARVILVGCGGLMADGALFGHVVNAVALVPGPMPARDMAALLAFHADRARPPMATGPAMPRTLAEVSGRRLPCAGRVEEALAG